MAATLTGICVIVLFAVFWIKRARDRRELEEHSITPEELHTLLEAPHHDVQIFDVRQPLDLLANSEIIPGAKRLAPKDVIENPSLIPKEKVSVVYCTCPSDKTSKVILHRALSINFLRVKFLKGGLTAWKAKGFPVEPYNTAFHLDSAV